MKKTMPKFKFELTPAQYTFVRGLIHTHEALGDCSERGFELGFDDYEGVQAFSRALYALPQPTIRAYVTVQVIGRKIDAAVIKGAK